MLRFILNAMVLAKRRNIFQYIPCYGLSHPFIASAHCFHYFNTSHVTVYQYGASALDFSKEHFNTSHVTVYHPDTKKVDIIKWISIHPMLRFIKEIAEMFLKAFEFQYIPCYGLPPFQSNPLKKSTIFQYIPCYGLSNLWPDNSSSFQHFNTSHVTVYQIGVKRNTIGQ